MLRGVTHGAVDFLIKPVRIEELRNIWQHVLRRRRELVSGEATGPVQPRYLHALWHLSVSSCRLRSQTVKNRAKKPRRSLRTHHANERRQLQYLESW